nr:MAG TPA: hypothetical protein [Caudoviricetes sp.]
MQNPGRIPSTCYHRLSRRITYTHRKSVQHSMRL